MLKLRKRGRSALAPLSESRCLYYRYERWRGDWEKDSDGDDVRVWTLLSEEIGSRRLVLSLGKRQIAVPDGRLAFENLELRREYERRVDGEDIRFREYVVPIETGPRSWESSRTAR